MPAFIGIEFNNEAVVGSVALTEVEAWEGYVRSESLGFWLLLTLSNDLESAGAIGCSAILGACVTDSPLKKNTNPRQTTTQMANPAIRIFKKGDIKKRKPTPCDVGLHANLNSYQRGATIGKPSSGRLTLTSSKRTPLAVI